jgi:hypothetical protein
MTSRTTDIHCEECSKYLFSTADSTIIVQHHYCKKKVCQQAKLFSKLKGDNKSVERTRSNSL